MPFGALYQKRNLVFVCIADEGAGHDPSSSYAYLLRVCPLDSLNLAFLRWSMPCFFISQISILANSTMKGLYIAPLGLCHLLVFIQARSIVIPPARNLDSLQQTLSLVDIDIDTNTEPLGLTTFANLPHINCFRDVDDVAAYDIAILGAPFDTVSQSMATMIRSF